MDRLEELTKQIEAQPGNSELLYERSRYYCSTKKYDNALDDINQAIEIETDNAKYIFHRGRIHYFLGEREKSLAEYNQSIALGNKSAEIFWYRGMSYFAESNLEKALDDANTAIESDPEYANGHRLKGAVLLKKEEYEKAFESISKALVLDPNASYSYATRGDYYYELKEFEKALDDYSAAIRLEPNSFYSYCQRSLAYKKLSRYDESLEDANASLKLKPNSATAYNNRSTIYFSLQEYGKALADVNKAIDIISEKPIYFANRASIYHRLKDYKKAAADYHTAAEMYEKKGNDSAAQEAITRAEQMEAMLGKIPKELANIHKLMAHKEMETIEKQVNTNRQSYQEFINDARRVSDDPVPTLHILQRWNSYTPIVAKNYFACKGGGYFIRTKNKGIVIDPGLNFIDNFQAAGFLFSEIDEILITHAHNDHTADLESILTLLHKFNENISGDADDAGEKTMAQEIRVMNTDIEEEQPDKPTEGDNKKPAERKKINIYLTISTYKKYANYLLLGSEQDYSVSIINEKTQPFPIDGVEVGVIKAKHDDLLSDKDSVGFTFTFGQTTLIYTGDTGFDASVEEQYNSLREKFEGHKIILLAHLGGFKPYETQYKMDNFNEGKAFYKNHLGRLGLARLVEILKPQICIISEFGEEFESCRDDFSKLYQNIYKKTTFFPADIGFKIDFEGKISAVVDIDPNTKQVIESSIEADDVDYVETDDDATIHYYQKDLEKAKVFKLGGIYADKHFSRKIQ